MAAIPSASAGPRPSSTRDLVGPADDALLRAVFRYHYLSAQQLCRLLYSAGSLTRVQAKVKRLADAGYLQRLFLPRPTQHGSAPSVYCLAQHGRHYLAAAGFDVAARYRPSEQHAHAYLFLRHTLDVNDVLIGVELLCRRSPTVRLETTLHERELKLRPLKLTDAERRAIAVIPDAWLDLRYGRDQVCLALELNRGTVEQKRWRRKVRALLRAVEGPYQAHFGTDSLTIAVIARTGPKRLEDLLRWTEREMPAKRADLADLFRFAALDPAETDPAALLFLPIWSRPLDRRPVPLLEEGGNRHATLAS